MKLFELRWDSWEKVETVGQGVVFDDGRVSVRFLGENGRIVTYQSTDDLIRETKHDAIEEFFRKHGLRDRDEPTFIVQPGVMRAVQVAEYDKEAIGELRTRYSCDVANGMNLSFGDNVIPGSGNREAKYLWWERHKAVGVFTERDL